jgi:hypothetical protein
MNSRHWLATALASLFITTATLLPAAAEERIGNSRYYNGENSAVKPASATNSALTSASINDARTSYPQMGDACDACDVCAPPGMWFVEAEALLWWRKSRAFPPLVTTSLPNTPQADAGVLGLSSTLLLFGGERYEDGVQPGGRISFGRFLGPDQHVGIAASFFALGQDEINFNRTAAGINDILAIPFFDSSTGEENALLVNFPGVTQNGRVSVTSQNDVLGADVYLRKLAFAEGCFRVDAIGGYQFSRVDDMLSINAVYDDVAGIPNSNFNVTDIFDVRNEFHGGSVGFLAYADHGRWTVKMLGKCGIGNMNQSVTINGATTNTPVGGAASTEAGGLFTQPTNIGTYDNNELVFIPEAKINFGYRATENWTLSVGYSFMYWTDIVTAGDVFDSRVNPTQIPGPIVGPATPAPPTFLDTGDFWVQGLNFSAEFVY